MLQKKLKILLVEDDSVEIAKLQKAISKDFSQYVFSVTNNSEEASSILESMFPDIIIVDLNTPEINGIEFITFLKKSQRLKHIPIIILSEKDNKDEILKYYKIGISGYLLKTLKQEEYELKINSIIKYWSLNEFIQF